MDPSDLDVLIVDDHEAMRTLLVRVLGKTGVQRLRTADSGVAALNMLKERTANLILADNQMSGMNGMELLAAVRGEAAFGAPKIIIVSGNGSTAFASDAVNAGADAVLVKPVSLADLLAAINRLFAV